MASAASTRKRPSKDASLLDAILEHQKGKRKKRRTPTRVLVRMLAKKKTRGGTALVLLAAVLAVGYYAGPHLVLAGVALVAFLIACEAWPELARWGGMNRRQLVPFAALALMGVPAALAVTASARVTAFAGIVGLVFVAYSHANLRIRKADHSHARGYIPRAWLPMAWLAAAWTIATARFSLTRPVLGVLLAGWLVWSVRWWFVNRTRTSHQLPLAKRWIDTIANPDKEYTDIPAGDRLVGSKLVNVRSVPGGAAATVVLPAGQKGSRVDTLGEVIASIYGVLVTDVTVDESTAANKRELFVLPKSPLRKPHHWKGSDLNFDTWTCTIGSYIDGERVQYVFCVPDSGPWHDLIAGTTRSGKSRLLDQLLTTSRQAKGYMVDWVIDPQNGQSLPDWVDEVDWFAAGVEEGMKQLRAVRSVMYARNKVFSQMQYVDRRGRTKKGLKGFTPTREYPQLNVTIDEAHAILQLPEAVTIIAEIGKMGSKCGIKLRLVVHLPLLSELGNSSVIRDMVASGNVIVLRTASRITGQVAFQGALPVDPVTIPRRMPDGSHSGGLGFALGAESRRAPMRLDWVEDPLDFVESTPVWHLPRGERQAAGRDYAAYRATLGAETPELEDVIDADVVTETPAPAAGPTVVRGPGGITCADRIKQIVRAADGNRVSRSTVAEQLVGTWGLQQITKTIKALCVDDTEPVWSDDERTTLYYKEAS